jgi:hypothetical protein
MMPARRGSRSRFNTAPCNRYYCHVISPSSAELRNAILRHTPALMVLSSDAVALVIGNSARVIWRRGECRYES